MLAQRPICRGFNVSRSAFGSTCRQPKRVEHRSCNIARRGRRVTVIPIFAGTEMITRDETIANSAQEAARLRKVLSRTTTPAIKARLLERIEQFERIARGDITPADLERVS